MWYEPKGYEPELQYSKLWTFDSRCECEWMDSEAPLFMLYTSGSVASFTALDWVADKELTVNCDKRDLQ